MNFGLLLEKWCALYIPFKIIDPTPRNFESYGKEAKIKNILLNTNIYNHCPHGVTKENNSLNGQNKTKPVA